MPHRDLSYSLRDLKRSLKGCRRLIEKADEMRGSQAGSHIVTLTKSQYEMVVQLSYLQAFLAWEGFVEDAFVLYLMGKSSPKGYKPTRYAIPKNRAHACDFAGGGNKKPDWTAVDLIVSRADRFFRGGQPFRGALRPKTNVFNDLKSIRNAVAHASGEAQERFKSLVRRELTHYPPGLTVGGFLLTVVPGSTPPTTFYEQYFKEIQSAAERISR